MSVDEQQPSVHGQSWRLVCSLMLLGVAVACRLTAAPELLVLPHARAQAYPGLSTAGCIGSRWNRPFLFLWGRETFLWAHTSLPPRAMPLPSCVWLPGAPSQAPRSYSSSHLQPL